MTTRSSGTRRAGKTAVRRAGLMMLLGLSSAACAGGNAASQVASAPAFAPRNQSTCGVTKNQGKPLIVEWPSAERGELEAHARTGLVLVRYEGCEMEVLDRCTAPGVYGYAGLTRKDDRITMRDADDLYATIPVHAASFEAKLQKSGELNVTMVALVRSGRGKADVAQTVTPAVGSGLVGAGLAGRI